MLKPLHLGVMLLCARAACAGTNDLLVDRLMGDYAAVRSVSCEIRREASLPDGGGTRRQLSRVHWQRPDRLHVDTVAPLPRRIVADGQALFSYIEGDPKGFSRPIERLDPEWLLSLRKIPATPTEQLLRLQGLPESGLPGTPEFPERRRYQVKNLWVVLNVNEQAQPARFEYFADEALTQPTAVFTYSQWRREAGAWFAMRQEAILTLDDKRSPPEVTQVLRLEVNTEQSALLFDPARHFKKITFTDKFEEIYKN